MDGFRVAGVGVADDAQAGVAGEDALEAAIHFVGAIGDHDHSGVLRVADADAAAVVDGHPDAPAAVLTRALSRGQSAMASVPSRMPSVSR